MIGVCNLGSPINFQDKKNSKAVKFTTMSPKDSATTIVDQTPFVVPEITIKQLLDAVPFVSYPFLSTSTL